MRKLLPIIVIVFILFSVTGCREQPYPFKGPISEIESIEIVSAESSLEYTVIKTLSETEKEAFLGQFKRLIFRSYVGDPPGLYGIAVKITYKNGLYEMVSYFAAEYVKNGVIQYRWLSCDENTYNNLLDKFLEGVTLPSE
ncbi:MAG: hypothetical protein LBL82_01415 [Oscillospiraceae bacterium]|nr:hypothetical protein [Oscillospiraceae bacterium]